MMNTNFQSSESFPQQNERAARAVSMKRFRHVGPPSPASSARKNLGCRNCRAYSMEVRTSAGRERISLLWEAESMLRRCGRDFNRCQDAVLLVVLVMVLSALPACLRATRLSPAATLKE